MPGSGTRNFLDPDHYEASLRRAQIELIVTCGADFKASLTWVELHHLLLLRCEEDLPRIGYVSFPGQLACISFPTISGPLPLWRGSKLQAQDILFHRPRRSPASGNVGSFDLERDRHRSGAAQRVGRTLFRKNAFFGQWKGTCCDPPRAMQRDCGACTRKPPGWLQQGPKPYRIPRSHEPLNKI
jgi:hypothetical protein